LSEAEAVASLGSGIKRMAQIILARSRGLGKKRETVDAAQQKHESKAGRGLVWKKSMKDISGRSVEIPALRGFLGGYYIILLHLERGGHLL
jgi:hypothetical protein